MNEAIGYVFSDFLLKGAVIAVEIASLAMLIGLCLGLVLALMRLSPVRLFRAFAWSYIWFMRGTPQLLQLVFIYDALPAINIRLDSFSTAVLGLGLNEAAFAAEIIRGGILSVNRTQELAAASLGMGRVLTLRRIVLPQAMRAILPGIANDAISLIKMTSIASVIFVNELTFRAQQLVAVNFKFFTVFAAAAIIYLFINSLISILQNWLEIVFDHEADKLPGNANPLSRLFGIAMPGRRELTFPPDAIDQPDANAQSELSSLPEPQIVHRLPHERSEAFDELPSSFVSCRSVWKSYQQREVLRGIDLSVQKGDVIAILGRSGSGKSTLLRLINHLEAVDSGEIKIDGAYVGYEKVNGVLRPVRDLAKARAEAKIGMVFQQFNLFSHLTALENVIEAPIRVLHQDPQVATATGCELLASVGLANHANHLPHRLSGGQQQRVAIARALALAPNLMLFDEPTSALDPELVGDVLLAIRKLADAGMTMLIVTHEIKFARDVADRVVFIVQGKILESGPSEEILRHPQHEQTQRFLRQVARQAT
jgi:polar amino acid transport system permease protein